MRMLTRRNVITNFRVGRVSLANTARATELFDQGGYDTFINMRETSAARLHETQLE